MSVPGRLNVPRSDDDTNLADTIAHNLSGRQPRCSHVSVHTAPTHRACYRIRPESASGACRARGRSIVRTPSSRPGSRRVWCAAVARVAEHHIGADGFAPRRSVTRPARRATSRAHSPPSNVGRRVEHRGAGDRRRHGVRHTCGRSLGCARPGGCTSTVFGSRPTTVPSGRARRGDSARPTLDSGARIAHAAARADGDWLHRYPVERRLGAGPVRSVWQVGWWSPEPEPLVPCACPTLDRLMLA